MLKLSKLYLLLGLFVFLYSDIMGRSDSLIYPSEYQKNEYEYIPDVPKEIMEERLKKLENEIPLHFNLIVRDFINYFTVRDRSYTRWILKQSKIYFPLFEKYLAKYNLPDELKYLAVVESGLNPNATSPAGAVGLWQFMKINAKHYDLEYNYYIDERRDPEKSTEAACKMLKWLYESFDDWELALAAYNSGYGNVKKAIRASGGKRKFWSIYPYLLRETRSYVPQFVALVYTMNYPQEHNFFIEDIYRPVKTDFITINGSFNLEEFAEDINICYEDLKMLNPKIRRKELPDYTKDFIPEDKYEYVTMYYFQMNKLFEEKAKSSVVVQNNHGKRTKNEKITGKSRKHVVEPGDSLWKISQKYKGVTVQQLRNLNELKSDVLKPGQKLIISASP